MGKNIIEGNRNVKLDPNTSAPNPNGLKSPSIGLFILTINFDKIHKEIYNGEYKIKIQKRTYNKLPIRRVVSTMIEIIPSVNNFKKSISDFRYAI